MNNSIWNKNYHDYSASDFLYHCGVLIYPVAALAPAYKLLSALSAKETSVSSLYAVLLLFSMTLSLMPLAFFRGVRKGEIFLQSYVRFSVIPHVNPSWFHGGVLATFRAVVLPLLIILPFLLAFPPSCPYPVERLLLFLLNKCQPL